MNQIAEPLASENVAGGQPQRLANVSRSAALHDQLYRYAEDLQQMVERNSVLEAHYEALRESCTRLTESRALLDDLVSHSHDIHIVTDALGTILQCNPAAKCIAPLTQLPGYNLRDWILPGHHEAFQRLRAQALGERADGSECELRLRRMPPDDAPLIAQAQALAVPSPGGGACTLHWVLRDVTRLHEIQFESQISTMVFKSAVEGVMITSVTGEILAVNPAFTRITGYSADEAVGRRPSMLKSGLQDEAFYGDFWRSLVEHGSWQGEIYNRKKNGEIYPEWLTISAARDSCGQILTYIGVFSDLSRLLQAEKRLSYLAHHDTLTGLPNRLLLQDRLTQTLAQSRRSGTPFSVIFIDLDRFKQINDSLGHEVGDLVLKEAARRLGSVVREADTVARIGGDEFVILAPGLAGDADLAQVCDKALDALAQPILAAGHELFIGGSFGCAEYPRHGDSETLLLKHADVAMYRAKASGGNSHAVYESRPGIEEGMLRLETELRHAIDRSQLRLEFQPQVAADGGETIGVEALLRWDHPQQGAISPALFIPMAEEVGLINAIGAWVIDKACAQLAAFDAAGLPPITMAVNVSPRQLRDPDFPAIVQAALRRHGVAADRLELEVTESEVMRYTDPDHCRLSPLRALGVKVAIDDFGTGYSSLARLKHLPIDRLKIDRSFIIDIEQQGADRAQAITAAIIAMGHALGLHLVAEGVENSDQLKILADQGCHLIQGYHTGKPMRPEALGAWLAEQAVQQAAASDH